MVGDPDDLSAFHDPAPGTPMDRERVLLTPREQRILEAIEGHLWRDDPMFVERFEGLRRRRGSSRWWRLFHPWR